MGLSISKTCPSSNLFTTQFKSLQGPKFQSCKVVLKLIFEHWNFELLNSIPGLLGAEEALERFLAQVVPSASRRAPAAALILPRP